MEFLLVYTEKITNRINYILTQLLFKILKLDFELTTDLNEFTAFEGPKISYANTRKGNELFIKPSGLLHQTERC